MEACKKILAVDDYIDNLITLGALIEEFFPDVEVLTATNGEEALALASVIDFDIAIFDIVMPEMDGYELCTKFKKLSNQKDVPIVFITASKDHKDNRIKALEVGADAFLTKPIDQAELIAQIRAMFKIRESFLEKIQEQERLNEMVIRQTQALQESNQHMESLLSHIKEENNMSKYQHQLLLDVQKMAKIGSFEYDHLTQALEATNEFWKMCGVDKSRYTHDISFFKNFLLVDDLEMFNKQLDDVKSGKRQVAFNCRIIDGLGIEKNLSVKVLSVYDANGAISGYRGMLQDITAITDKEQALKAATKEAKMAKEAQSRFLANMSHEIRTPLNGIIGMLDLSLMTSLSDEQKEYLETARLSAQSLLTIIGDILDYSKIEADKLIFKNESVDLREMFQTLEKMFLVSAQKKNLKLSVVLDSKLPQNVIIDRVRLSQVMSNLLGNAVKFTENGNITCVVNVINQSDTHAVVSIHVKDTGIGISSSDLDNLFDRFTQFNHSNGKIYNGTGLGLAISKRLINLMGSDLLCESEVGVGSNFHFNLSLPIANIDKISPSKSTNNESISIFSGLRILVADDDLVNQSIIRALMKKNSIDVTTVNNGMEVIEYLEKNEVDLILLDVNMPVLSGYDTVRIIKNNTNWKEIPVIAMTAYAMESDKEKCIEAGYDGYVSKPIDFDLLKREIFIFTSEEHRVDVLS